MKNAIRKSLLAVMTISVLLSLNFAPAMAENTAFTARFTETVVNEDENIYKLTIYIKGYCNTAALDIAFVYDSTYITPIDANEYLSTGAVIKMDKITPCSLRTLAIETADNETFSLQLSTEISLDQKRNALSISAYNTAEHGFDLSTETEIFEMYYQVVTGKDYFSVATSDAELFAIYGSVNGAGITVVAKNGDTTCYVPHSASTIYADSEQMNTPVFSYIDKRLPGDVNGDGKVTGADTNLIFRYVSGMVSLSEEQQKASDVNGDGRVTGADTNLVFRYVSGTLESLG